MTQGGGGIRRWETVQGVKVLLEGHLVREEVDGGEGGYPGGG